MDSLSQPPRSGRPFRRELTSFLPSLAFLSLYGGGGREPWEVTRGTEGGPYRGELSGQSTTPSKPLAQVTLFLSPHELQESGRLQKPSHRLSLGAQLPPQTQRDQPMALITVAWNLGPVVSSLTLDQVGISLLLLLLTVLSKQHTRPPISNNV